jgi:uncharacterized protein YcfJ
MNAFLKHVLALAAVMVAGHASAGITFYEHDNYHGRAYSAQQQIDNFKSIGFNDRASSVVVNGEDWEVCEHAEFHGRCMVLRPGSYPSLGAMDMNDRISSARPLVHEAWHGRRYAPPQLPAEIVLYEHENYAGRALTTQSAVTNFRDTGFNDRASSVVVFGERWEVCEHAEFRGNCLILRPGRYPSLAAMGFNDRISSVRAVPPGAQFEDVRYAPQPAPVYDWRRRPQERVYTVSVDSVRAVYAAPQQRCWVEKEQVVQQQRGDPNVGGAVVGGIIGGILGHQVGGGTGRDVATVGGAVAGAAIGANVGRGEQAVTSTQNVQRCAAVPAQGGPQYWDVTYRFRGIEHHMQTNAPPGSTVLVNESGEPRV